MPGFPGFAALRQRLNSSVVDACCHVLLAHPMHLTPCYFVFIFYNKNMFLSRIKSSAVMTLDLFEVHGLSMHLRNPNQKIKTVVFHKMPKAETRKTQTLSSRYSNHPDLNEFFLKSFPDPNMNFKRNNAQCTQAPAGDTVAATKGSSHCKQLSRENCQNQRNQKCKIYKNKEYSNNK